MSKYGRLLAPCVLALAVLVACNQPPGLPIDVGTTSGSPSYPPQSLAVDTCKIPPNVEKWTGSVSWYQHSNDYHWSIGSWIDRYLYVDRYGEAAPRRNGYSVIHIPPDMNLQPCEFVNCTLAFWQEGQSYPYADLKVTWMSVDPRATSDAHPVWDAAWDGYVVASLGYVATQGWYKIPFNSIGEAYIRAAILAGCTDIILGWIYTGGESSAFARVHGNGWSGEPTEYKAPYIIIHHNPPQ